MCVDAQLRLNGGQSVSRFTHNCLRFRCLACLIRTLQLLSAISSKGGCLASFRHRMPAAIALVTRCLFSTPSSGCRSTPLCSPRRRVALDGDMTLSWSSGSHLVSETTNPDFDPALRLAHTPATQKPPPCRRCRMSPSRPRAPQRSFGVQSHSCRCPRAKVIRCTGPSARLRAFVARSCVLPDPRRTCGLRRCPPRAKRSWGLVDLV